MSGDGPGSPGRGGEYPGNKRKTSDHWLEIEGKYGSRYMIYKIKELEAEVKRLKEELENAELEAAEALDYAEYLED